MGPVPGKMEAYLNTAASVCMAFCISKRTLAVDSGPVEVLVIQSKRGASHQRPRNHANLILSKNSILSTPASSGMALWGFPGVEVSLM